MCGEAAQLVENVAGDEHGDPMLSVQTEDQLTHFDDPLWVEPVCRLVEHEQVRVSRERHGNAEPLTHAERKIPRLFPSRSAEPDEPQQLADPALGRQSEQPGL